MSVRLPVQSGTELPTEPRPLVDRVAQLIAGGADQGYARISTPNGDAFLFVLKGKPYSAGAIVGDRCVSWTLQDFFKAITHATSAVFCATDLPLFLCTAVLFRKQPVAQIPSDLIDSETLIKHVRSTGKDAVLVIRRGDARSLVFCRSGEPAALYPAPEEEFPFGGNLADRIVKYVFKDMTYRGISLDLYDEIKMPPSQDAGKTLAGHLEEAMASAGPIPRAVKPEPPKAPPNLLVWLGDRVVSRLDVIEELVTIGRELDNHLVLDNLSVSRHHARMRRAGDTLIVEDLGSQNGILVRGQKVQSAELGPGDEVQIGKYKIVYARYAGGVSSMPSAPRSKPTGAAAVEKTMALMPGSAVPIIEYNGQKHKIKGLVFTIGKDSNAHIRIGGLFVAPVHVRIFREPDGIYRIEHVAGRKQLKVNGRPVKKANLQNGDELVVGSHQFLFTVPAEGGAPTPTPRTDVLGPGG